MEELRRQFHLDIRWVAFPLHPETPLEGQTLERFFAGRGLDIPAMLERLGRAAAEAGLPWGQRTMTFNSRRAQELGKWAEEQGRGEEFHMAAFKAYFAEGLNIAQITVLRQIAARAGLDPDRAERALASGVHAAAVDRDWALSRASGITAVPSFLAAGRLLVGAQPYPVLAQLASLAGAERL